MAGEVFCQLGQAAIAAMGRRSPVGGAHLPKRW